MSKELFVKSFAVIGCLSLIEKGYKNISENNIIHKEISQNIISCVQTNTFPQRIPIKSFDISTSKWNLDFTNYNFANALNVLKEKYSNVEIKTSNYPLETHLFVEYDKITDTIKISFND
jgi:hypothetical protein